MTEGQVTQKKGLGPLAWIAIGCGALILIAFLVMSAGIWFGARKVKDIAKDFEEDPARSAAEMIVKMNPELELVESDDSEGTITIREKATGEVATFDYSAIQEGKLKFESSEGTISFDATGKDEGALLTVESEEGTRKWAAGGKPAELPGWLPDYPGAEEFQTAYSEEKEGAKSGSYSFVTQDSPAEVLAFYRQEFESSGMEYEETTTTQNEVTSGGSLTATDEDMARQVTITVAAEENRTRVGVFFSDESE